MGVVWGWKEGVWSDKMEGVARRKVGVWSAGIKCWDREDILLIVLFCIEVSESTNLRGENSSESKFCMHHFISCPG